MKNLILIMCITFSMQGVSSSWEYSVPEFHIDDDTYMVQDGNSDWLSGELPADHEESERDETPISTTGDSQPILSPPTRSLTVPNSIVVGQWNGNAWYGICPCCHRLYPITFAFGQDLTNSPFVAQKCNAFDPLPDKVPTRRRDKKRKIHDRPLLAPSMEHLDPWAEVKLARSQSFVFDAFILCAVFEKGVRVIDPDKGTFEVTDYKTLLRSIGEKCPTENEAIDDATRGKVVRGFLSDCAQLYIAGATNFKVELKRTDGPISAANLRRFKDRYPKFCAMKENATSGEL